MTAQRANRSWDPELSAGTARNPSAQTMNKLTGLFLIGTTCVTAVCAEIPSIIANGFDAYKGSGSKAALAIWLQDAPPTANVNTVGLPPDLGPGVEKPGAFGPMESYEVIATYSATSRLRRIYAVAYFQQGPLFFCFDLYRTKGAWVTYGLKLNTDPELVIPIELIEKRS